MSRWRSTGPCRSVECSLWSHCSRLWRAWMARSPWFFCETELDINARFTNFNDPDWRHATTLYLIDADPRKRDEWALSGRALELGGGAHLGNQRRGRTADRT